MKSVTEIVQRLIEITEDLWDYDNLHEEEEECEVFLIGARGNWEITRKPTQNAPSATLVRYQNRLDFFKTAFALTSSI